MGDFHLSGEKFDPHNVIFVGNKADLLTVPPFNGGVTSPDNMSDDQTVSMSDDFTASSSSLTSAAASELQEKARASIAGQLNCPLIDTSARHGRNVLELFHSALWPMLFNGRHSTASVSPSRLTGGYFGEDSPLRRQRETEMIKKKISWPWRNASDHPVSTSV